MTPDPELGALLAIALHAADIARDVIMPLYESGVGVELKSDGTPVTDADRRAEAAIREFLARECPDHSVLGEEYGESAGSSMYRWLLDPIDGTKSFIHHDAVPASAHSLPLSAQETPCRRRDVCHALNETASAAAGHGAHLNGRLKILRSRVTSVAEATVLTTFIRNAVIASLATALMCFFRSPCCSGLG
ncbi:MAG: hypothetical protein H6676_05565 [Thermoflexaceae bacterium]|nr:hypothetical protein [Thermoflexaceae bacterium]